MGISHKIHCQTHCLPAEFLCNLPKNLTMHLTHKFCLVLPLLFFIDYGIINVNSDAEAFLSRFHISHANGTKNHLYNSIACSHKLSCFYVNTLSYNLLNGGKSLENSKICRRLSGNHSDLIQPPRHSTCH
ncbi:hypothetical protein DXB92_09985 [Ruminococcus sp. OM06-36AC]|nr:hypothetical protein DXB92_09985 [Ruminococcus sp. OM06-36AC]